MNAKELGQQPVGSIYYHLTKRELFAAIALGDAARQRQTASDGVYAQILARTAVTIADALLAELAKDQP